MTTVEVIITIGKFPSNAANLSPSGAASGASDSTAFQAPSEAPASGHTLGQFPIGRSVPAIRDERQHTLRPPALPSTARRLLPERTHSLLWTRYSCCAY